MAGGMGLRIRPTRPVYKGRWAVMPDRPSRLGYIIVLFLASCGNGSIRADGTPEVAPSSVESPAVQEPWAPIGEEWSLFGTLKSGTLRTTVYSTPGAGKANCFAFEFQPARLIPVVSPASGPPIPPPVEDPRRYKERDPGCVIRRAEMDRTLPVEVILFPNEDDAAPYNLVIGQVSEQVERLHATFNSGASTEITADDGGIFVLQYPADQRLVNLKGEQPPIAPGRPKGTFECAVQTTGGGDHGTPRAAPQVRSIPGCSTDD